MSGPPLTPRELYPFWALRETLDSARQKDEGGPAADLPAAKGRVPALRSRLRRLDRPGHVRIDDGHVGDRARPERTAVDAENTGRVDGHLGQHLRPGQD